MILTDVITISVMLILLAAVIYGIRHMGSGFPARSVLCPHENRRAIISTSVRTPSLWSTKVQRDVLQCSLLPGQPVTCDKSCLVQL